MSTWRGGACADAAAEIKQTGSALDQSQNEWGEKVSRGARVIRLSSAQKHHSPNTSQITLSFHISHSWCGKTSVWTSNMKLARKDDTLTWRSTEILGASLTSAQSPLFSQCVDPSFSSSHRNFQHHLTHPLVCWLCCREWKSVYIFVGGKWGHLCAEQPGLWLASKGSAPFQCQRVRSTYAFSPRQSIFARRLVSACVATGMNTLVFFGQGLRKMMVWPWTFLDLKRQHPSFSKWYFFFSDAPQCSIFPMLWGNELHITFGILPRLKMNSPFRLAFSYSKDSCVSSVQERHEKCIAWSTLGTLQCFTQLFNFPVNSLKITE